FVFLREERVESGPPFGALLGEPDDLTLCSHGPWTHGAHRPLMWNSPLLEPLSWSEPGGDTGREQGDRLTRRCGKTSSPQERLLHLEHVGSAKRPRRVRHSGYVELDATRWQRLRRRREQVPARGPEPLELRRFVDLCADAQHHVVRSVWRRPPPG